MKQSTYNVLMCSKDADPQMLYLKNEELSKIQGAVSPILLSDEPQVLAVEKPSALETEVSSS